MDDLDQTDDFSTSCTPYIRTARRAMVNNQPMKNTGTRHNERRVDLPEKQNTFQYGKKTDCPKIVVQSTSGVKANYDVVEQSRGLERDIIIEAVCEGITLCRLCNKRVSTSEHKYHVKMCMQEKFSRKNKNAIQNTAAENRPPAVCEIILCQICQKDITNLLPEERNTHVNRCIDSKEQAQVVNEPLTSNSKPSSETDGNYAQTSKQSVVDSEFLKAKPTKFETELNKDESFIDKDTWRQLLNEGGRCPLCEEDVTSLLESGRMLHMNHCVDQYSRAKGKKKAKVKVPKKPVLECPLCGKPAKTENSRKTHMKSCAKKLGVDTATLMTRVKQQEEEHELSKLAQNDDTGTKTEQGRTNTQRRGRGRGRGSANVRSIDNGVRPSCVDRVLQEHTELALALSTSLAETNKELIITEKGEEVAVDKKIEPVKNAYAILMSPSTKSAPLPTKRVKKKYRNPDYTPALIVESREERENKLARKIETIVMDSQGEAFVTSTPQFKTSRLENSYLGQNTISEENKRKVLWDIDIKRLGCITIEDFYVQKITPPLQVTDVKKAQRNNTLTKKNSLNSLHVNGACDKTQLNATLNESVYPSTQTAVVLAHLAADETTLGRTDSSMISCEDANLNHLHSGTTESHFDAFAKPSFISQSDQREFHHEERSRLPSGFIEDESTELKHGTKSAVEKSLLNTLGNLVDNPAGSDLMIITAENETVHAHRFIMRLRCPEILQLCKNGKVNLQSVNRRTVLSFMKYLYAADIHFNLNCMTDLLTLAERFHLDELKSICQTLVEENDINDASTVDNDTSNQTADKTLQNILKEVWGSDSENSESESTKSRDSFSNPQRRLSDEISDDEYNDVMQILTQQVRRKSTKELDERSEESDIVMDNVSDDLCSGDENEMSGEFSTKGISKTGGFRFQNMTLHERMTRALLNEEDALEYLSESSNQSDKSSHVCDERNDNEEKGLSHGVVDMIASDTESVEIVDMEMRSKGVDLSSPIISTDSFNENELKHSNEIPIEVNSKNIASDEMLIQKPVDSQVENSALPSERTFQPLYSNHSLSENKDESLVHSNLNDGSVTPIYHVTKKESLKSGTPDLFQDSPEMSFGLYRTESSNSKSAKHIPPPLNETSDDERRSEDCEIIQSQELGNLHFDDKSSPVLQSQASDCGAQSSLKNHYHSVKKVKRKLLDEYEVSSCTDKKEHTNSVETLGTTNVFEKSILYKSAKKYSPARNKIDKNGTPQKRKRHDSTSDSMNTTVESKRFKRSKHSNLETSPLICLTGNLEHAYNSPRKENQLYKVETEFNEEASISTKNREATPERFDLNESCPFEEEGCDANVIDLTYESDNSIIKQNDGVDGELSVSSEIKDTSGNGLLDASTEIPVGNVTGVWDNFNDQGFDGDFSTNLNEKYSSGISTPKRIEDYNSSSPKSAFSNKTNAGEGLEGSQKEYLDMDELQEIDLGSSFSSASQHYLQRSSQVSESLTKEKQTSVEYKSTPKRESYFLLQEDCDVKTDKLDAKTNANSPEIVAKAIKKAKFIFRSTKTTGSSIHTVQKDSEEPGSNISEGSLTTKHNTTKPCSSNSDDKHERLERGSRQCHTISSDSDISPEKSVDPLCIENKIDKDVSDEYDPPTDISVVNCSYEGTEREKSPMTSQVRSFKTPQTMEKPKKKAPSEWVPPSPFTPMPEYSTLATPHLQREAAKFGLRQFPKKRAIALLKNIYEAGHQYESDPEFDQNACDEIRKQMSSPPDNIDNESKPSTKRGKNVARRGRKPAKSDGTKEKHSATSSSDRINLSEASKRGGKSSSHGQKRKEIINESRRTNAIVGNEVTVDKSVARPEDYDADDNSDCSSESRLNSSLDNSDCEEVLEETMLQASPSKKLSKRDANFKRQQIWEFLQKSDDICIKIMHFEPLEFDEFHNMLKDAGFTGIGTNIVSEFLDEKGIPYTMRNLRKDKPTWQKKKGKKTISASQASQAS